MKRSLPWKKKADETLAHIEEHDTFAPMDTGTVGPSPFVEPFRPLYDIRDDRLNESYQTRPLYTPSSTPTRRSPNHKRITSSYQPYPVKSRNSRGSDRYPYRRDRSPFGSRSEQEESMSMMPYQWLGAILLVGILYLGFHSSSPLADRIQSAATNAMHTDYNVSKITAWFETHIKGNGTAVPVSSSDAGTSSPSTGALSSTNSNSNSNSSSTVTTSPPAGDPSSAGKQTTTTTDSSANPQFVQPVANGKITSDYKAETQQEMIITANAGSAVNAAAAGTVAAVSSNPQQGTYVLIDHGNTGKTLYGHLGDVTVKQNQKVTANQTIAHLDKSGKTADMYFGYIVNGKYEDPHSIISFH